jgi:hypothetical protein
VTRAAALALALVACGGGGGHGGGPDAAASGDAAGDNGRDGVIGNLMDPSTWTDTGARVTDCTADQEHLYCFEQ